MTEASSFFDGTVSFDELNYFDLRGGQTGIFISPAANVSDLGKGFEGQLSIADDKFVPRLKEMAIRMKKKNTKAIVQIFHAGRLSNSKILRGDRPVSPSDVPSPRTPSDIPRELTNSEINQIIEDFGEATRRAILAGFDGVELHGANGYLLQQFFSPHSNVRTDRWGGNFSKRITFVVEVIDKVSEVINEYAKGSFILGYRLSPEEATVPGITIKDTLRLIDIIADKPLDYLHVSQRYVWRTSVDLNNGADPLIFKIKEKLANKIPLIAVGAIATPEQAEEVLNQGIDFVALGREFLIEPQWLNKINNGEEDFIKYDIDEKSIDQLGINPTMWNYITTNPNDDPRNLKKDISLFWR